MSHRAIEGGPEKEKYISVPGKENKYISVPERYSIIIRQTIRKL
jgi:hypothetical protein